MKFNGGLRLFAPLLLCLQAADLVKSYGAFFPNRGRPSPMSRGRTNSRSRHNPYTNSAPAGVFCKNGQFAYGCCKGWERNAFGQCQPVCESRCMHGRCIGPNRCQCDEGWTGKTCNTDYNECAVRPCAHRCMNMQGSYKCYCEHGYLLLPDGRSCTADDRCYKTRCAFGCLQFDDGFKCYCPGGLQLTSDGLGCQDIDECSDGQRRCARNRRCVNTYGNYMCLCPEGYHYAYVEGSLDCVDMNECDMKMDKCDTNAHCINAPSGYDCECNEGYIGDGYRCIELDSRSCGDIPCFPGADCIDIEVDIATIDLDEIDSARSFTCGECPSGLAGDGIDCAPSRIELRILVADTNEALNIPSAEVTAFDQSDGGRRLTSSLTDNNGVAVIEVPMFSDLILTASKDSYVDNSVTYQVVPGGNPFLEIGISRATDEIVGTYNPQEDASFRFTRSADDSFIGAINIPQGGLDVAPGTHEAAYMIVPDAANATELGLAPVLQADPSSAPIQGSQQGQEGALSGLAESQQLRGNGRTQNGKKSNNKRGKGNMQPSRRGPLADDASRSLQDSLQIETNLPNPTIKKSPLDAVALAYISLRDDQGDVRDRLLRPLTIEIPLSKYENKGLHHGDEMAAWKYDEVNGLWTYAGTGVIRSLPGDPNSLIFVYETTTLGWIAAASLAQNLRTIVIFTCTDATCRKRVPHVPLWLHGMDSVYAEPVITDNNGKGEIVVRQGSKFTLEHRCNGKSKHFHGSSDVKQIDLAIHGEFTCPDPGEPDNGVRFGDDFTFGSEVTYFCFAGYNMQGSSRRFCNGCGIWSGYQTFCVENVDSDFSSLSSFQYDDGF